MHRASNWAIVSHILDSAHIPQTRPYHPPNWWSQPQLKLVWMWLPPQAQATRQKTKRLWQQIWSCECIKLTAKQVKIALGKVTTHRPLAIVSEPTTTGTQRDCTTRSALENACLAEAGRRFTQANNTPCFKSPLWEICGEWHQLEGIRSGFGGYIRASRFVWPFYKKSADTSQETGDGLTNSCASFCRIYIWVAEGSRRNFFILFSRSFWTLYRRYTWQSDCSIQCLHGHYPSGYGVLSKPVATRT